MNVVVGEALDHQTPLFVEQLEYIVFRPFWNPPRQHPARRRSCRGRARTPPTWRATSTRSSPAAPTTPRRCAATPENLDKVQQGRLALRQRPGPSNSLGLAKFIFPNDENVYMHGTPSRGGFAKARRDLSHGCVRLEDPAALATLGAARPARVDPCAHRRRHERRQARARRPPPSR